MSRDASPGSSLVTLDDAGRYAVTALGAVVTGLLSGWLVLRADIAFYDLHVAVWLSVAVGLATAAYFATKRVTSDVIGSTLYLVAVLVVLKPLVHYAPTVRAAMAATGHRRSQLLLEGLGGLLTWGLPAAVLAVVFVAIGRLARSRARRIRLQRARTALQEEN